jgi:hypothetical protein
MGLSIYRGTRSARLRVTTSDGEVAVVENMEGDKGYRIGFEARRTMDGTPGEFRCTALNLSDDILGAIDAAQPSRIDDLDKLLAGKQLQSAILADDGSDALAAGFAVVELEAGYDGVVSRIFKAIGVRIETLPTDGDVTQETIVESNEGADGVLSLVAASFEAGTPTFDVVDYLRRVAGLGPGNLTPANFAAVLGDSRLDSPYHSSGGQALARIDEVLKYLDCRWFVDDREIWICARDGVTSPTGALPWVADGPPEEPEPLIGRPRRVDGGYVEMTCFLCPRLRPGRLLRLTPGGLALAEQGLSPSALAIQRARVPPGLYRMDEVVHRGTTGPGEATTTAKLRPVVLPDVDAGGNQDVKDLLLLAIIMGG